MKKIIEKSFFLVSGWLAILLGTIGAFLPLLPTTPFIILAAFCFSKSSERLHNWLLQHKVFGSLIQNWERYGVIQLKAKWLATISIVVLMSYPIIFGTFPLWLKAVALSTVSLVMIFIWTRPSQVPQAK